jgi:uncharacterized membrane protein
VIGVIKVAMVLRIVRANGRKCHVLYFAAEFFSLNGLPVACIASTDSLQKVKNSIIQHFFYKLIAFNIKNKFAYCNFFLSKNTFFVNQRWTYGILLSKKFSARLI